MSLCPASVLVTGANRGIGLEFVKQFLKLPSPPKQVFAGCRSPDSAKELQDIARSSDAVTVVKIDLSDLTSVTESVEIVKTKLGDSGLSLLINNAGILHRDDINSVTPEAMLEHFKIHVSSPMYIIQNCLPLLKKAAKTGPGFSINKAAIINISSGVGSIAENTSARNYAYRTAKAAQNMVTKNMSLDLKDDGIFVAAVHPGWVKTEMGGESALVTTEESVGLMFKLMSTFQSESEHGKFYHSNGREMAW